jgi:hypothetical protein
MVGPWPRLQQAAVLVTLPVRGSIKRFLDR